MLSVRRRKAAQSSHQPGHEGGEGEAGGGAGQAGLTPCLTPPAPPPAATGGSSQPTILSSGNNSELSGAVSSAAAPRGDDGSVSLSWASGTAASPVGEGPAAGLPSVLAPPSWCPPTPVSLPGLSSQRVPYTGLLFAQNERGGRQEKSHADSARVSGHVCSGLCHYGRDGQLSLTICPPLLLTNCHL